MSIVTPNTALPKLLLVENEAVIIAMIQKFFVGRGFDVTIARTYDEYYANRELAYAAAIVDCSLEGALNRDGLRVVRDLKMQSLLTYVIMFTANQDPALQESARQAGADEVLIKPASLTRLDALIQEKRRK